MRAITVRQPWAWAIIHGGKDVENRSRNIAGSYRGPVAIHAGLSYDVDAVVWDAVPMPHAVDPDDDHREPRGAIIGVVDLVDVHAGWIEGQPCSPWGEQYRNHEGQWHMTLANPRKLAKPIPCRGRLGLWTVPEDIAARIEAAS